MAAKRKVSSTQDVIAADAKIARIMALGAVAEFANNPEKCVFLRSVGFTNPEIAAMLNMSNNQVAVAFVQSRKKKRKKRA